ncbi:MAG: outer membrane beta-barrel protein [Hyphomicrobium sp.]|nr:outer membrane beta-barrel protein [Hyphomicrobium sp.]
MKALRNGLVELSVLAALGLSATAAVADGMYSAAPSYREMPSIWSGLYGGVHLGYADADNDDGVVGGVQLGYNWQSSAIVYGVEGDISLASADSVDWLASARGRLGYLLQPSLLLYGTAGVGGEDDAGFVYGLGIESQLTYGTTGRIEYLEYDGDDVGVIRAGLNFQIGR